MKKYIFGSVMALMASCTVAMAEVEVSGGVDLVSTYTWRGIDQTGPALQPGVSVSAGNFSLSAWGSTPLSSSTSGSVEAGEGELSSSMAKELDFTLGYSAGGFSVAVTDYWWAGESTVYFNGNQHQVEVTLGYEFGEDFPLAITWNTMVCGDLDKKDMFADAKDVDDQAYSTYIDISYPFAIQSVDCTASVGITPWKGAYADKFDVASVALNFSKDLVVTDKFSLPLFLQVSAAPAQRDAYLVAGLSFGF